jgi:hypothetical protein
MPMPSIAGMPFKVDDTLPRDQVWMVNTGRGMGKTAATVEWQRLMSEYFEEFYKLTSYATDFK